MNVTQARGVVGVLIAYFPWEGFPRESVEAWAAGIAGFEFVDGLAAANELGRTARRLPPLVELVEATNRARIQRLRERERALPEAVDGPSIDFAPWLADSATEDERASVGRTSTALREKYGIKLEEIEPTRSAPEDP